MSESCAARMAKAEDGEGGSDRQRHHGEEDGAYPEREQTDEQRQHDPGNKRDGEARERRGPRGTPAVERKADTVAADAIEHGVGEGDDAGVAEQQVVARHQHDEDADLGRRVDRLRAREQERSQSQCGQDCHQHHAQHPASRQVVRQDRADHPAPPRAPSPLGGEDVRS
jgi:hypothetical protein